MRPRPGGTGRQGTGVAGGSVVRERLPAAHELDMHGRRPERAGAASPGEVLVQR